MVFPFQLETPKTTPGANVNHWRSPSARGFGFNLHGQCDVPPESAPHDAQRAQTAQREPPAAVPSEVGDARDTAVLLEDRVPKIGLRGFSGWFPCTNQKGVPTRKQELYTIQTPSNPMASFEGVLWALPKRRTAKTRTTPRGPQTPQRQVIAEVTHEEPPAQINELEAWS